jgi:hypothetical protein
MTREETNKKLRNGSVRCQLDDFKAMQLSNLQLWEVAPTR